MFIKRILKTWRSGGLHPPDVRSTPIVLDYFARLRLVRRLQTAAPSKQVWQPALLLIATFALFTQTLIAGPFDRHRQVTLDELRLDGDLNLSLSLARVALDEKTTLELRVEHEMRTGDYGNARSDLIVRPLHTNVVPYDRQDLIWNKPNGEKKVLLSEGPTARPNNSPGQRPGSQNNNNPSPERAFQFLPEAARTFMGEDISRRFTSSKATAYSNKQLSKIVISSEQYWFGYANGSLSWFILPTGKLVNVQSEGGFIRNLAIDGVEVLNATVNNPDEIRIRTKTATLNLEYNPSFQLSAIKNAANVARWKFEYNQTDLLSTITTGAAISRYAWQENRQDMPKFMNWMKPYRLRSVNEKNFGYTHDYDYIKMQIASPPSELLVTFRYGQIVSIKKR